MPATNNVEDWDSAGGTDLATSGRWLDVAIAGVLAIVGLLTYSGQDDMPPDAATNVVQSDSIPASEDGATIQSVRPSTAIKSEPAPAHAADAHTANDRQRDQVSFAGGIPDPVHAPASMSLTMVALESSPNEAAWSEKRQRRYEPQTSSLRSSPAAARRHFGIGLQDFFDRRYAVAVKFLESARELDPDNALYVYFIALAQLRSGERQQAEATVARAVAIEATRPICDWGTRMERVQGPHRRWLEVARTSPGLGAGR